MKKCSTKMTIGLIVLGLVITNIITGLIVASVKNDRYDLLKSQIQSTIDKNQAMEDELNAYSLACPDAVLNLED